jgi:uncharacterized RDD family membrane protein YckC
VRAAAPPEPKRRRYTTFPDEVPAEGAVVDHSAAFERDLLKSLPVPASLTTETDLSAMAREAEAPAAPAPRRAARPAAISPVAAAAVAEPPAAEATVEAEEPIVAAAMAIPRPDRPPRRRPVRRIGPPLESAAETAAEAAVAGSSVPGVELVAVPSGDSKPAPAEAAAVVTEEAPASTVAPQNAPVASTTPEAAPAWMAEASAMTQADPKAADAPAAPAAVSTAVAEAVANAPTVAEPVAALELPTEITLPAEPPVALTPVEPASELAAEPAALPEATIDLVPPAAAEAPAPAAELVPEPASGTGYQPVLADSEEAPSQDAPLAACDDEAELIAAVSPKVKPITVLPVSLPAAAARADVAARTGTAPVWGTAAPALNADAQPQPEWRREVSSRVEAYRARRQRDPGDGPQSDLPFVPDGRGLLLTEEAGALTAAAATEDTPAADIAESGSAPEAPKATRAAESQEELEAIAARAALRYAARGRQNDTMVIATVQPELDFAASSALDDHPHAPLVPVADVGDRRTAGLLDAGLLVISYGLFLLLFSSLGGKLSWGKVDALIYAATFFLFYAQYFALFTVFGGVTPGMLVRGLRVVAFDGTAPQHQQLLWRSFGYVASAAGLMLGFVWPLWDEDHLSWHDRISHTYLTHAAAMPDPAPANPAATR